MKKFAFLAPFFVVAACGGIDNFNLGQSTIAQGVDCNEGGAGGGAAVCECNCPKEDGSRLKSKWFYADDGTRVREEGVWDDTEIGETCSFQDLPNGEARCVPKHDAVGSYVDSSCTIPVYVHIAKSLKCETPADYIRIDDVDFSDLTCGGKSTGFTIYKVDLGNSYGNLAGWYGFENGLCKPQGKSSLFEYAYYHVFKIGDESKFVKLNKESF